MSEPAEGGASPLKVAIEAIKAAAEVFHPEEKAGRPGPLVVVGRFYVSLTLILAVVTSASALIDLRSERGPTDSVLHLRWLLMFVLVVGLGLGVTLLIVLMRKHALYLFNPTEYSKEVLVQLADLPESKEELKAPDTVGGTLADAAPPTENASKPETPAASVVPPLPDERLKDPK